LGAGPIEYRRSRSPASSGVRRCYEQVCALAPYRLEHIDIPWNGTLVSGNLHLCPGTEPRPLIFYIPGCDTMKEGWPHPQFNFAHARGMHVFSFDGPGQAECNLRGIKLTSSNYEEAASTAIDYLVNRPEVDAERIGVYGVSFGSHWGYVWRRAMRECEPLPRQRRRTAISACS
jgi:dipeptidyl aminopeptidase/acylaminoacyl peptidase